MLRSVPFLDDAGNKALAEAIEEVEARSRAEVVVVVRPVAGSYLGVDLLLGNLAAFIGLWYLLQAPWELAPILYVVQPVLTIAAVVGLLRVLPILRRPFISDARRHAAVHEAAAATFFHKHIGSTRERTGVLVFVALFEQRIEILADTGIIGTVPKSDWRAAAGLLEGVFHDGGGAVELAERIKTALGPRLERWCESRPDDVDELPNELGA
jgi:putative membrane protein